MAAQLCEDAQVIGWYIVNAGVMWYVNYFPKLLIKKQQKDRPPGAGSDPRLDPVLGGNKSHKGHHQVSINVGIQTEE